MAEPVRDDHQQSWWVFDVPLSMDPIFWASLATGAVIALQWFPGDDPGAGSFVVATVILLLGSFLAAAVFGAVRRFVRGLTDSGDEPPPPGS